MKDKILVPRTVFLSREIDELIRQVAFELRCSKSDVMRNCITDALANTAATMHKLERNGVPIQN